MRLSIKLGDQEVLCDVTAEDLELPEQEFNKRILNPAMAQLCLSCGPETVLKRRGLWISPERIAEISDPKLRELVKNGQLADMARLSAVQ